MSWEFALDVAADLMKYTVARHGANAYSMKTYSYQFVENTYANSKFSRRHINTAAFTFHDTPSDVTSTPGFRDAGFDNFGPSYKEWGMADALMIYCTDPYETKTKKSRVRSRFEVVPPYCFILYNLPRSKRRI